jgi:ribosomal protein S18 acetylase RimI-like enzyme/SAM-dependent methyltransferase
MADVLTIRTATEADAPVIASIIGESFRTQAELLGISRTDYPNYVAYETEASVRSRLDSGTHIALAAQGDQVVGTVSSVRRHGSFEITRLAVLPAQRGKGYGRELMEYAEKRLVALGAAAVEISIVAKFQRLQAYYEQLGYLAVESKRVPSLPFELLYMRKLLETPPARARIPEAAASMNAADEDQDIPYGEDWQSTAETTAWADAADRKRPWRSQVRDCIAERVNALRPPARVLELGSGPGFLAERVLEVCSTLASYTLLDFSEPMLAMSRARLSKFSAASFIQADFKAEDWVQRVAAPFDCVVSMQAVHEVRHKRHVPELYRQIHQVMAASGRILICDHTPWDDTRWSTTLFMTEEEQIAALSGAGFVELGVALSINRLALYEGRKR